MKRPQVVPALMLALLTTCSAEPVPFTDLDGSVVDPLPSSTDAAVVWVFVTTDCPIANGYAPEIEAIGRDYIARSVRLIVVHTDPSVAPAAIAAHAAEHGLSCPVIVDPQHALVAQAGATMTPEAVVFDSSGALRYRGRIDDRYPDLGVRRPEATKRELRDALDAVLAGRPVAAPSTEAVGCVIEGVTPR